MRTKTKDRRPKTSPRRGVLLLVILALLAMFAMVGVAFVLITGHAQRSAKALQRVEQFSVPPQQDLHQCFLQIARGTNNPASVLIPHSLLEDEYGNNSVRGTATIVGTLAGGQLLEFTFTPAPSSPPATNHTGCVITLLDGPTAGCSFRVVGQNPVNGNPQMVAFDGTVQPAVGVPYQCVINGVAFGGSGIGFNPGTGALDMTNTAGQAFALLPNPRDPEFLKWIAGPDGALGTGDDLNLMANEDYDAVDYQNMILAALIPDPTNSAKLMQPVIPSLHRPELINFCSAGASWTTISSNLLRKVMLRPIGLGYPTPDHPAFTGSNPTFNAINGPWDVDNDGDGVPDSVWVDLGFPARPNAEGKLYKPLFAILCVDLDGRLNLNAHGYGGGNLAGPSSSPTWTFTGQLDDNYYSAAAVGNVTLPSGMIFADSSSVAKLPRGQGYGPAEINLSILFPPKVISPSYQVGDEYKKLLLGNGNYAGRYGEFWPAPPASGTMPGPTPGLLLAAPNTALSNGLGQNKEYEYAGDYWSFLTAPATYAPDNYGTPPDLLGVGATGLDLGGRPIYWNQGAVASQINNPYNIDLSLKAPHGLLPTGPIDDPFSPSEFERLARPFDRDTSTLPARLLALTSPTGSPNDSVLLPRRYEATSESWDVPVPALALPAPLRSILPNKWPAHVTELLVAKGVPANKCDQLLPPELLAGLRMNVNRPFGNARDDNTNGVVDESDASPAETGEVFKQFAVPGTIVSPVMAYDPTGTAVNSFAARQLYARYLYVLAMLLTDDTYIDPAWQARYPMFSPQKQRAYALAQWAVNVVDFRDRDSIMTPFEFDIDPFTDQNGDGNPWDVDGIIGTPTSPSADDAMTYRGLVWGCERPELLIAETLAFHDRRTEDTDEEQPSGTKTTDTTTPDTDFDQKRPPQGSLFVKLFNPGTVQEPSPREFCLPGGSGVVLTMTNPGGKSPVWRLAITNGGTDATKDLDDPDATQQPTIERTVYFVDKAAATLPAGGVQFCPDSTFAGRIAPILPGRYMVIGPGDVGVTGTATTYIGFKAGTTTADNTTRRIELNPSTDPTVTQVAVFNDGTNNDLDPSKISMQPPVAAVINNPQRLSISEPDASYPGADPTSGLYVPPYDNPLDAAGPLWNAIKNNDRTDNVKVVHLQRLANPLLPYDSVTNPYRTVDSMPIDLTTFNGVTTDMDNVPAASNIVNETNGLNNLKFYSRQRGQHNYTVAGNPKSIWRQEPLNQSPTANSNWVAPAIPATTFVYGALLNHALGHLNDPFGLPLNTPGYVGDPPTPFPWLTWLNRPFVSQLELMLVPAVSSRNLLATHDVAPIGATPYSLPNHPFPHLADFFHSGGASGTSLQLHRILEYLRVPSRFIGTEIQGSPVAFAMTGTHQFHTPFNGISCYREPGRINLNTVFSADVWKGLMNFFPETDPTALAWQWDQFWQSRQGYGGAGLAMNNALPTRFARPFRSFAGADMVPLASMKPNREVDITLLRSDGVATLSETPLLTYGHAATLPVVYPNDTDRNPYFRYQSLERLGNLVTNRSNVYAVWITVGYFEVTPWGLGVDANHPDGYQLGQELGSETGDVQRHRAFYIFDRSIPVGFQRGQDLNVEKAILLKRVIE